MNDCNVWIKTKSMSIQEIVDYPPWQELRKTLIGTWERNCVENTQKLKKFLRDYKNDEDFTRRVRIVYNYLTGSYFRINSYRLCKEAIKLRDEVALCVKNCCLPHN